MPSLYVLYIDDPVVGPCLELIRKVCEPESKSKPHLTVRGPIKDPDRKNYPWRHETISEIQLINPGAFFSEANELSKQNTVFIECDFPNLGTLYYKPDLYRSSRLPHITVYDGNSRRFAKQLLALLNKLRWRFNVRLPRRFNTDTGAIDYPTLTELVLNKKRKAKNPHIQYEPHLAGLFYRITSETLAYEFLRRLTDDERLALVESIYNYLETQVRFAHGLIVTEPIFSHGNADRRLIEQPSTEGTYVRSSQKRNTKMRSHEPASDYQEQLELLQDLHTRANAKPRHLRSQLGQFLTPPELAIDIAHYVKSLLPRPVMPLHFGDPAVGTGTFFSAVRRVFSPSSIASAFGIEIDDSVSSMTHGLWADRGLNVVHGDFFRIKKLPPKRNLILCNPPYVRHQYMAIAQKEDLKAKVKSQFGIVVSGLSSLYLYFMLLCHDWMESDAIAAWLVPTEFMEVNYGAAIRQYLTEKVSTILIHRFDPKEIQFDGVIVTSCVVVLQNRPPCPNFMTTFSSGGTLLQPKNSVEVSISELKKRVKWPVNIGVSNSDQSPSIRLRDLFKIRRGIATGANSFFILTRKEARQRHIPERYLRPVLPGPRQLLRKIVESEADGYPKITPQLCLIDCELPESELRKRYPKFWEYLKTAGENHIRERYLIRHRHPWYRQEQRPAPPFLCTYLGRDGRGGGPFRFIWNRSNATATNQYLLLYPSEKLASLMKKKPKFQEAIFNLLQSTSMAALREGGRIYGGGLYKLEPSELGAIASDSFLDLVSTVVE